MFLSLYTEKIVFTNSDMNSWTSPVLQIHGWMVDNLTRASALDWLLDKGLLDLMAHWVAFVL